MKALLAACLFALLAPFAFTEDKALSDPVQEARAQSLMRELRCVACENEPISQSSAPIAEDMRKQVRKLVQSGETDEEIRGWFEARYGAFVRFRPKATSLSGWLLWTAPFWLLAAGALALSLSCRRQSALKPDAVRPEDA